MKMHLMLRASRWPFLGASLLPYAYGAAAAGVTHFWYLALGAVAVAGTHLSANLINDYADARSGVDAADVTYYGFFGGSKLIQEKVLMPEQYRLMAAWCAAAAAIAVTTLAILMQNAAVLFLFAGILALGWAYSHAPMSLSYRMMGEGVIFLLFGPATVIGAAYIQRNEWPPVPILVASIPFGLLTTAILVSNEIPDHRDDAAGGKRNLVGLFGAQRGYVLFGLLVASAYCIMGGMFLAGWLHPLGLIALPALELARRAAVIQRRQHADKAALTVSSRLVIQMHALASVGLIAGVALCNA